MADSFEIQILEDGTIKSTTGKVGAQNHQSAEGFFGFLARVTGGKYTRNRRGEHAKVRVDGVEQHEHN